MNHRIVISRADGKDLEASLVENLKTLMIFKNEVLLQDKYLFSVGEGGEGKNVIKLVIYHLLYSLIVDFVQCYINFQRSRMLIPKQKEAVQRLGPLGCLTTCCCLPYGCFA